jgi:phenylpropionate dioxygenase-like ring-hydroxylating dioxygenase large terminal subunit
MRRYWQPFALCEEATNRPRIVRLLGEDLILFRDQSGRAGLLYPRCMHRGTSLYYGKVNEHGIRCCYHGWLFDVQGNCLEQPCEPERGLRRDVVRQPWYPVQERYGLIFGYMGPPDKTPVLPRIESLETLGSGEFVQAFRDSGNLFDSEVEFAGGVPYNWLQAFENLVDPYHVYILHSTFTEVQFHDAFKRMPKVEFERVGTGVIYHARRDLEDGRSVDRISHAFLPNMSVIPSIDLAPGKAKGAQWWVPFDDTHYMMFHVAVVKERVTRRKKIPLTPDGKTWDLMSEAERQDYPSDLEAQLGQGAISLHSEEHLAKSDIGIVMLRRLLTEQIKIVQQGGDPLGCARTEADAWIPTVSGNYFKGA